MGPIIVVAALVALRAVSSADTDAMLVVQQEWGLGHAVHSGIKDLGHSVGEGAEDLGHSAEMGAKKLGHSAEESAKDLGHSVEEGAKDLAKDPLVQSAEEDTEDLAKDLGHSAEQGAKDLGHAAEEGAKDLGHSAEDFVKATKDKALREAASALGLCKHGNKRSKRKDQPTDTIGCEIVAQEVASAALTSRIDGVVAGAVAGKLTHTLVHRASSELCESIHDWLVKHHALKLAKPLKYVAKLRTQLHKRVDVVLDKYTADFCDRLEEGLFADSGPVAPRGTAAALPVALAGAAAGLSFVTLRLARRAAREATLPLCSEEQ